MKVQLILQVISWGWYFQAFRPDSSVRVAEGKSPVLGHEILNRIMDMEGSYTIVVYWSSIQFFHRREIGICCSLTGTELLLEESRAFQLAHTSIL